MEHFPLVDRLHTDVLEEKWSDYFKDMNHNQKIRLAHLVDNKGIPGTFAITLFLDDWTSDVRVL
jgi:hypothetical protein